MLREAVVAALVPGWNMWRRSRALAVALVALGCGVPLAIGGYAIGQRRPWVALSLDAAFLQLVVLAGAAAISARLVALSEVWWAHGRPRSWHTAAASVVLLATVAPLGYATVAAGQARAALAPVFGDDLGAPLWNAQTETAHPGIVVPGADAPATTAAPPTSAGAPDYRKYTEDDKRSEPGSDPDEPLTSCHVADRGAAERADVATILLLGGDAGPGRWSLRTDTIMLFSIHRPSGRASLVSVPRNLMQLRFPPGSALGERFPLGFDDLANAVYPRVQNDAGLREAYRGVPGVDPGVVALSAALGCSLGVTIDDYVLIDMRGFVELVDALGGVTVDVPRQVPMPGNIPGGDTDYPHSVGPGVVHMSGTIALGYVRSRSGDSDYQRTARQRHLLAALAEQVNAGDVIGSYRAVAGALGETLRTSLSPDELTDLLAVIGGETAIVESVGLVPPLVNVNQPDWPGLADIVADVQAALVTGSPSGR